MRGRVYAKRTRRRCISFMTKAKKARPSTEGGPTAKVPDYSLDDHISYLINRVGIGLATLFSRDAEQFGMNIPMWRVLAVLIDKGEQRLIDLSELTAIDPSTLSRITDAMHSKRIISRVRSRLNRRELVISATDRGREIAQELIPAAVRYEDHISSGISHADIETTKRTLRRMFLQLKENCPK
jgi:MarR family transcriptional regulator, organic hydroperoxide resistance regulator